MAGGCHQDREQNGANSVVCRREDRDLVRRRLSLVLHRQAPPGERAGGLRARRRRRDRLPLLPARPVRAAGARADRRRAPRCEVRRRPRGRPADGRADRGRGRRGGPALPPRRGPARQHGRRPPAAAPRPRASGGPALQAALKEELLAAYFLRAENVADHDLLRRTAEKVGLDRRRGRRGARPATGYADAVERDIREAAALGATGVPFFVVDRKYGVSGAQPAEVFAQVLERAWAESHPQLEQVGGAESGDACGPDGCAI